MKCTIGFLFILIIVSMCSSLREIKFIQSLYPDQSIPKPLYLAIIKRRIDQVNAFYENLTFANASATGIFLSTNKSLSLLLDLWSKDQCISTNDANEFYQQTVYEINQVFQYLKIDSVDLYNANQNRRTTFTEFKALVDAYIGDIQLVRDYQVSNGNYTRVDMKIVEQLNSLSDEMQNIFNDRDIRQWYASNYKRDYEIGSIAIDQCSSRLSLLLKVFKRDYIENCRSF